MFSRQITSQAVLCDFKFASCVAVCEEAQDHDDVQDGLKVGLLECTDVDGLWVSDSFSPHKMFTHLTVVSKPVSLCHQLDFLHSG